MNVAVYEKASGAVVGFVQSLTLVSSSRAHHALTVADLATLAANPGAKFKVENGALVVALEVLTPEQLAKKCADHSQARLDGLAQAWEYDNITTLRAAALSSVPRFQAEGLAGQAAWDAEWSAAQAFKAAALAGQVAPTFENYVAALPALPARPVVNS